MTTIVLIHGLFGSFGNERLRSRLSGHRVVVPDLLGYGEQVTSSTPITVQAQVDHLHSRLGTESVVLVGHSVGWVICVLYAQRHPAEVSMLVDVEGNFSLQDAFWSAELARKPAAEVGALLKVYRADPAAWFGGTTDQYEIENARAALAFQPASTLQAMASSVVAVTGDPGWEAGLQAVFDRTPVHLIAGEMSRSSWHVPAWAQAAASGYHEIPDAGHMMTVQQPEALGDLIGSLVS